MPILQILVVILVAWVIVWLVQSYGPKDVRLKRLLVVIVVILACLCVLWLAGILPGRVSWR